MGDSRDRPSKTITAVEPVRGVASSARRRGEACVVVLYGPELGKRATVGRAAFQIGRSSKNELPIDQESVSRHHARITSSAGAHVELDASAGKLLVGSGPLCELRVADPTVSRRHASLVVTDAGLLVTDLGSTNGTFVNDERVTERRPLRDGDQIKVGRSILKFMSGANIEANYHEEIYRLMTVDALTQVYNKRYFGEVLEREYNRSQRYKRELSLLLCDVDHFKKVNDVHGHLVGDGVLRQVAAEMKQRLREQDIFARVGGEELAALLPEIGLEGALVTGEKLRKIVESTAFVVEQVSVRTTISIGVATLDGRVKDPSALYERADAALYEAKSSGRNRVKSG